MEVLTSDLYTQDEVQQAQVEPFQVNSFQIASTLASSFTHYAACLVCEAKMVPSPQ